MVILQKKKKVFKVDDLVAIAGLTADGRVLSRYCRVHIGINYSYTYESPLLVGRLVVQLVDKAQVEFIICLLLTLLGHIPGIIYTLYAIVFVDSDQYFDEYRRPLYAA
ncbi:hypothetical protein RJT34_10478 [Clitoria ternatea]|uniref:Uncharacterized protein n=1 Tax=Clitoria ternatea TaxID=43366 RepID=A0AAN9K6S0_CLITE